MRACWTVIPAMVACGMIAINPAPAVAREGSGAMPLLAQSPVIRQPVINQPAITSVLDRVKGFEEAISRFPGMKIVADVNGQGVRDRAMQAASDVLQAHPDIQGIFGINDDSALGALDAAQQFKRMNVVIIGYDATPPAVDAITKGTQLKADVIQYPRKIGSTTIQKIKEYFAGQQVPGVVPVEVGIVDKDALTGTASK